MKVYVDAFVIYAHNFRIHNEFRSTFPNSISSQRTIQHVMGVPILNEILQEPTVLQETHFRTISVHLSSTRNTLSIHVILVQVNMQRGKHDVELPNIGTTLVRLSESTYRSLQTDQGPLCVYKYAMHYVLITAI